MVRKDSEDVDGLASEFFSAIERVDLDAVRELYSPDVEVWHNLSQRTQSREENLDLLRAFTGRVHDLRYEVHAREFFPGGFVQRHTLHGKLDSGLALAIPVCLVIHVSEGRIERLYEYLDGAAVRPAFSPTT